MSTIQLYDHQQKSVDEIFDKFKTLDKVLYQLSTGGGKTFVFCFIAKRWIEENNTKVCVLCHRSELIDQTCASLNRLGISYEIVNRNTKYLTHSAKVYVCMIETLNKRLQKNPYFIKKIGLVISDECHILTFDKVFLYFNFAKFLGVTATPVVLKKVTFFKCRHCKETYKEGTECCDDFTEEWTKPFTMSEIYQDIVVGASINDLIDDGKLIQEISCVKKYTDNSKLKTDSDGEYTASSIDLAYNSDDAIFNVLLNYQELCIGKKTMVFNSSSKSNKLVYERFKEAGINVRMFDSVNKKESGCRKEVVKWFKSERDAVLLNVGVFTTGFDVTDVEAIMLNRPTNSLSLFLQMVGRGGRPTDKIYKDTFLVIDGGGNIDRHQEWSDPTRDWKKIFFTGTSKEKAKKDVVEDVQECEECGYLMSKTIDVCPNCEHEIKPKPKKEREIDDTVLTPIRKIPPPNGEKIYRYTLSKGENIHFAFKVMIGQVVDMFRYYRVSKEVFLKSIDTGELTKKVKNFINKCYFVLISKKDIASETNRTIQHLYNKILTKLNKYYGE